MSYFRDQLNDWLKQITVHTGRVLDVAAGKNPAKNLATVMCQEYVTLDINQEFAPDIVADIEVENFFEKMGNIAPTLKDTFDVIFCLELMEYTIRPMNVLFNIFSMMKPGGTLYISFPFLYPIHKPYGQDYMRYTEDGAKKLLQLAGFEILEVRPRVARNPELLKAFYSSDGMHTRHDDTVPHTGYCIKAKRP